MNRAGRIIVGVAVAGVLAFGVGACDAIPGLGGPDKPARQALIDAAQKVKTVSYSYTVDVNGKRSAAGVHEPTNKNATVAFSVTDPTYGFVVAVNATKIGGSIWLQPDLGDMGGDVPVLGELNRKWLHLQNAKLPKSLPGRFAAADTNALDALVAAVGTIDYVADDEARLAGTLDPAKVWPAFGLGKPPAPPVPSPSPKPKVSPKPSAKPTATPGMMMAVTPTPSAPPPAPTTPAAAPSVAPLAIPFEAAIDPTTGILLKVTITVPAAGKTPAKTIEVGFADVGTAPAIVKPPAKSTVEAPAAAYTLLTGV